MLSLNGFLNFREDFRTAVNASSRDPEDLYTHLKSGAESGWDFSTRWFIDNSGSNQGGLPNIRTRDIIPVDLNSFICMNARFLSSMYERLGDQSKAQIYRTKYLQWKEAIKQVRRSQNF